MGGGDSHRKKKPGGGGSLSSYDSASERSSGNISKINAYDAETASLQETLRINKALGEFRDMVSKLSEKNEKQVIKYCWEQLDEFMDLLRDINDKDYNGEKLRLNIRAMERGNREIVDGINGSIRKDILSKVNLDNAECKTILEMESGAKKKKAMREFQAEALNEAVDKLIERLKKSLYKNCDDIEDRISTRLSDLSAKCASTAASFKEFSEIVENDSNEHENKQLQISYQMAVNSLWLELLDEDKR